MATRKKPFVNNEYYHIYNRGVDKRDIFLDKEDYKYFSHMLFACNSFNPVSHGKEKFLKKERNRNGGSRTSPVSGNKRLVNIESFCLMPNHYHLLVRQLADNGISKFLQKLGTGYTHFFNKKHNRSGVLFQGKTKSKHVDKNKYLNWLKSYIALNPIDLIEPRWKKDGVIRNKKQALKFLKEYEWASKEDYKDILEDVDEFPLVSLTELEK